MNDWVKNYIEVDNISEMTGLSTKLAVIFGSAAASYLALDYFGGGKCHSKASLEGKTIVITGCNTGIGKETVRDLSKRGAKIIMACRNLDLAEKAAEELRADAKAEIIVKKLDLANLASIREFAKQFNESDERLDILINNAGVMYFPEKTHTVDGFEMTFGTNHLGPFLLTNLLLDKLKASKPARIVNVSSLAHERATLDLADLNYAAKPWAAMDAYRQSKLANVLFSRQLAKMLEKDEVTVYALHPGVVRTDLTRQIEGKMGLLFAPLKVLMWPFTKNAKQGAQTTIYCAVDEEIAGHSGRYYSDCKEKLAAPLGQDDELALKLWELSAKFVGL